MVKQIRRVEKAFGSTHKKPIETELKARRHARRSLVAFCDIPKGTTITAKMIEIKRPGFGIEPRFLNVVVGRKASVNIKEDTVIQWDMI